MYHDIDCQPIPRVSFQTPRELGVYLANAKRPIIGIGLLNSWKALQEWTPSYFAKHYGNLEVGAAVDLPATGSPYALRSIDHGRKMKLAEFVDFMDSASKACYIHQMSLTKLPELVRDIDFEVMLPSGSGQGMFYLWLGSSGTRSGLHFDRFDNINAQIFGKKSVFLVSPDQAGKLYPFKDNVEKSQFDPDNPQFNLFPRARSVQAYIGIIEPGEVLFIPKLWWHHIRSLAPAINVNCWYGEHISLMDMLRVVNKGGLSCWSQVIKDFVFCGLLGQKAKERLFSDTPTGIFLFNVLTAGIKRYLHPSRD
ncbi:lysine-specific demethylase 8 [Nitrosospira multiformis]|uniref:Lysine-specific demethylase 8 n=1 Tax=Nitrosospira multiformis TaxID=1231 RepID=A0A1H8B5N0_9PROT|nr:cupin-like domain-containing protein [Nitrosospira multiformis]SEM77147.1 lysine-specific demethylase 8 [Nitrosospira multiformis]